MEKLARKPSSDPVQEKLRQNKTLWNQAVSIFINDLIHLKKMMNGWPSKFYPERSSIKDPVPANANEIIDILAGQFQELAQRGDGIVSEQLSYSQKRRKRQPKQMNLPFNQQQQPQQAPAGETEAPKADLSQQLELPHTASMDLDLIKVAAHFEDKYQLSSEASNPLSRFIARLLNPQIGFTEAARIRQIRMELLKACAKTYKGLTKLQVEIVKKNKGSINTAYTMMHNVWDDWKTVRAGFNAYKLRMPDAPSDSGGPIETPENIKKDKAKENAAVEKAMDQVDRAEEEGKPTPDDADYDKEVDVPTEKSSKKPSVKEEKPKEKKVEPNWIDTKQKVMEESAKAETFEVAKRMKKDFDQATRKMVVFLRNNVPVDTFAAPYPVMESFVTRKENVALEVIRRYRTLLADLNEQCNTNATSLVEISSILVQREKFQSALDKAQTEYAKDLAKKQKTQKPAPVAAPVPVQAPKPAPIVMPEEAVSERVGPPSPDPKLNASAQLEATAQAFLKKWIGKTIHQMSPFDSTSNQRIQIFEIAEGMREQVDQIMDHLEKDLKVEEMEEMVGEVNRYMENIRQQMLNLHKLHGPKAKK